jgi:hypothetical protein
MTQIPKSESKKFSILCTFKRAELVRLKLQDSHSYHHWLNDLRTAPQHFPRIPTVYTEPQFLDVIGTEVLKVFLRAIHSQLTDFTPP